MTLVSVHEFAEAFGICDRVSRRAFANGKYKGLILPIVKVSGQKGGSSGEVMGLPLDQAPQEIQCKLRERRSSISCMVKPVKSPFQDWQLEKQRDRLEVIKPILLTKKLSKERTAAIRLAATQPHIILGKKTTVSEPTLNWWLKIYETKGPAGLLPKARADANKKRVLISRKWDGGIDLEPEKMAHIAKLLEKEATGMRGNDNTSLRQIVYICQGKLFGFSRDAGSTLPDSKLRGTCKISFKWAKRFSHYSLVHMHDKDHEKYQSEQVSRVGRELDDMPMNRLVGDVHYMDILVEEKKLPKSRMKTPLILFSAGAENTHCAKAQ